jgi:CRP/FNR family cyclic AMP-dependent transcriptional regulator
VWLLSPAAMADLKRCGRECQYEAGETLFMENDDPADFAVLILSGRVRVTAVGIDGREVQLAERGPQAIVGELSAIDGQPRSATVTAMEEVQAVVITADRLQGFLNRRRDAMQSLLVAIIGCLRAADRHQVEIRSRKASYHIARRLLELAEQHGDSTDQDAVIDLQISKEALGVQVGVTRVTVSRVLAELRKHGVVVGTGRGHIIVRLRALRQYLSS